MQRAHSFAPLPASFPDSACASCSFQEALFEYTEGGQSCSGTQGTLWSLQIWGLFFSPEVECVMEALAARCWETRLLPASHAAVAYGDAVVSLGLEVDLQYFGTPVGKKKISRGNWINIPLLTLAHTVYTLLPLEPKHRVTTWNLSMCWMDVEAFLNDLTKPSLENDLLSTFLFYVWNKTRPGRELIWMQVRFGG